MPRTECPRFRPDMPVARDRLRRCPYFQRQPKKNREPDEGVARLPIQPAPGKTAKSASPIASPGVSAGLVYARIPPWRYALIKSFAALLSN
jgi:hypothetical protein